MEGEDAYIYYQMNDKDQLCCITVIFMQPHTDYDIYINKFDSITEKLTLDYGEPKKEKGKGRLYGYCSSEGEALSIGEVNSEIYGAAMMWILFCIWEATITK